jgi:colicin import membrane protein
MIPLPQQEPGKGKSLALAAAVHLLLFAALFFGVQWKNQAPSSVEVEVWSAPPPPRVTPAPTPEPKPEVKPEPRPEPKPVPKAEPKPVLKPAIVIKEEKKPKKEEPKKEEPKKPEPKKEEPKKPEPKKEEPKKPEPKKEEVKREEPDWKKQLANEQKQLDQQKTVQDHRARADAEARQLSQLKAEQASASRSRGLADYTSKVRGKIRGNIVLPPNIQGNPEAIFEVTQLPSGEVLGVKVRKSSGNPALDAAIERAILKSSPLPKPDQPELFERVLKIPYRPLDE